MKKRSILIFALIITVIFSSPNNSKSQVSSRIASNSDSAYTALLINHLRNNFDDIHDVSMRFHHYDHRLNGIIQFNMHWENGRMTSSSVTRNDTKNEGFADALAAKLEEWYIKDLAGPFDISLPFRIQIVGSDDSTFFEKGILTGEIFSNDGKPVRNVKLSFHSAANSIDTLRNCYSNREGIFVKTLIPIGTWNIEFTAEGYRRLLLKDIHFKKGEHIRKNIRLQPIK
jgi:hypothetical protein